ncbi:phosphatidylglycerol lysyltransferase domain-containing protein [Psychrobacillus sp. FSL H8-0483]|uniref:phosphatidylglycerol lysyltransferase domain-containing protein n=1 Tax=Psychrobacillus sp. FSL H8-0483 TaxID=2921389 RepID=UPI00315A6E30
MNNHSREIILGDWKFNQIDIRDKETYTKFIKDTQYPTDLWSSNFDYLWGVSNPKSVLVLWKVINEMLVTFKLSKNQTLQLAFPPFGRGSSDKIAEGLLQCMHYCQQWNERNGGKTRVRAATKQQLDFLKTSHLFDQNFRYMKLRGVDKHIGINKVLDLSGREFKEVRENRNRFLRDYPDVVIRRAKTEDYEALLNLKQAWNQTLGNKYSRIWDDRFFQQIIKNHQKLEHIILVVETGKQIIGMVTGGVLPHGQAWSAFLKRREGYNGLSELLNVEFAREIHKVNPNVELINLGIESGVKVGSRGFKDKFRPVLNSERYQLYLKHQ